MKIKIHEAAKSLNLHPLNFIVSIHSLVGSLSDIWPEIDKSLIETLEYSSIDWANYKKTQATDYDKNTCSEDETQHDFGLSDDALYILDKLERKNFWGKREVNIDRIKKNFCPKAKNHDLALNELENCKFIAKVDDRGLAYSLNPSNKGAIEQILSQYRHLHKEESS